MEVATPGGTARAEDPGVNEVREAAEAVPPERVRRNGNQPFFELVDNPIPGFLFFTIIGNGIRNIFIWIFRINMIKKHYAVQMVKFMLERDG